MGDLREISVAEKVQRAAVRAGEVKVCILRASNHEAGHLPRAREGGSLMNENRTPEVDNCPGSRVHVPKRYTRRDMQRMIKKRERAGERFSVRDNQSAIIESKSNRRASIRNSIHARARAHEHVYIPQIRTLSEVLYLRKVCREKLWVYLHGERQIG